MKKKLFISISVVYFLPLMLTLLQGCSGCGLNIFKKTQYFKILNMYLVPLSDHKFYEEQYVHPQYITFWLRTDVDHYTYHYQNSGFSLMACSPPETEAKEIITSIEIYSNQDFEGFPAGTDLAPLIEIQNRRAYNKNLVEYLATKPKAQEYHYLYFSEQAKPISGNHQIKIIYKDSAKKVFEMGVSVNFN